MTAYAGLRCTFLLVLLGMPSLGTAVYGVGDIMVTADGTIVSQNSKTSSTATSFTDTYTETVTTPGALPIVNTLGQSISSAGPGHVGASAYVAGPPIGSDPGLFAVGSDADILETLMASNNQVNGYIRVNYQITGQTIVNFSPTGASPNLPSASAQFNLQDASGIIEQQTFITNPSESTLSQSTDLSGYFDVPITNGQALLDVALNVSVACSSEYTGSTYNGSCASYADYSHTALFGGAQVLDVNKVLEPGVTVLSDSGFDYNAPIVADAVPEPSQWAMLGLGLALISGLRERLRGAT